MEKVLGLDLGTNSIGWAIRDLDEPENQIIAKGVLTFEKGVGEEKGNEVPLVKKRTEARSKRRNYQAKKYRKWEMLKCLIENNPKMCPLTTEELNGWRKYIKGENRIYPTNAEFVNWLKLDFNGDGIVDFINPYQLRKEAAERKIENPMEIGRAFYHLVQRRGFRGRDEEESKTIVEGSSETGTLGANVIHKIMEEQNTTLGGALFIETKNNGKRIRKRYNLRTDFENELKTICNTQGIAENSELYKKLYKAIIWQRPLRTQKGNVGRCTFEPSKPRCSISHPLYEEYRALCLINNIKLKDKNNPEAKYEPLTAEQRETVYTKLFFRKSKPQFEFSDIIKLIGTKKDLYEFNYKEYTSISGCPVSTSIKELFGEELKSIRIAHTVSGKRNNNKDYYDYEDIWHVLFSFDSKEKLFGFAKEKLKLDDDKSEIFCKIKLQQGYASLSLSVIKKMLPLLRMGFIYSDAIYLANIEKVLSRKLSLEELNNLAKGIKEQIQSFKDEREIIGITNSLISKHLNLPSNEQSGRFPGYKLLKSDFDNIERQIKEFFGDKTWEKFLQDKKDFIWNSITNLYQDFLQIPSNVKKELLFYNIPRLDEKIKSYIEKEWKAEHDKLKYLYHPSETEMYPSVKMKEGKKFLGNPMPISRGFKNPMAMKSLHHLKRFINYLIDQEKIDENTRIVIEIARELNDANRRKAIEKWQNDREKQNKEYAKAIQELGEKYGLNVDIKKDDIIDKYRLWIEQNRQCLYTGKVINCTELFDGTKFDFEHTIPADLSFDNELKNLTISDSKYNREIKQKRIPTELPNYEKDATIGNEIYTAIKPRLKFIEEKVEHYKNQIEFWKKESKKAPNKERKDYCIQQRHYNQFERDYWNKKWDTFTITEYRAGWKNSQLRDTQIITKYALPYLKTVFNKVDVQKGTITSEFRKIYNIGFEKDRTKHTHHAIDAAILTLIPSSVLRDKLLKEHFAAMERNIHFHTTPSKWSYFSPQVIVNMEEEILVNFIPQYRTLVPVKKYVRKRGKIQYAKEKLSNGKWQYILDDEGKKIPLIAQGDSIRGQLHKETFYGMIDNSLNGNNDKNKLIFVERVLLKDFTSEKDFNNIIDPVVKKVITDTVGERMQNGKSFKEAVAEDIWMIDKEGSVKKEDKHGNLLHPIRHVRCKATAGKGQLKKTLEVKDHVFISQQEYKQQYYAQNKINYLYLLYQFNNEGKIKKSFRIIDILEASKLGLSNSKQLFELPEFLRMEKGKGKSKKEFSLKYILKAGIKVLVWKESEEELRDLNKNDLLKRLYRVFKFNEIGTTGFIYLQFHKQAGGDELGDGDKSFEPGAKQPRLRFPADNFNCLVEGYDFDVTLDGKIIFRN